MLGSCPNASSASSICFCEALVQAKERIRARIWRLYKDLKAYRQAPARRRARELGRRCDSIFSTETGFATLDRLLARLHAQKEDLLAVLKRPQIPLHTNGSENDIRCQVTRRITSPAPAPSWAAIAATRSWPHENLRQAPTLLGVSRHRSVHVLAAIHRNVRRLCIETIPDNALRHFRDDADARRSARRRNIPGAEAMWPQPHKIERHAWTPQLSVGRLTIDRRKCELSRVRKSGLPGFAKKHGANVYRERQALTPRKQTNLSGHSLGNQRKSA